MVQNWPTDFCMVLHPCSYNSWSLSPLKYFMKFYLILSAVNNTTDFNCVHAHIRFNLQTRHWISDWRRLTSRWGKQFCEIFAISPANCVHLLYQDLDLCPLKVDLLSHLEPLGWERRIMAKGRGRASKDDQHSNGTQENLCLPNLRQILCQTSFFLSDVNSVSTCEYL